MNINFTPAFPTWVNDDSMMPGMTLRDYFAALGMQATISDPNNCMTIEKIADWSYKMADAMMEARK